jgi:uncharacterized protein YjlB
MATIQNFKFTHKHVNSHEVGVVDRSEGRVFFAYSADSGVHSLPAEDFERRFYRLA